MRGTGQLRYSGSTLLSAPWLYRWFMLTGWWSSSSAPLEVTLTPHLEPGPAASLSFIQLPCWPQRLVICTKTKALRGQPWARLARAKMKTEGDSSQHWAPSVYIVSAVTTPRASPGYLRGGGLFQHQFLSPSCLPSTPPCPGPPH